MSFLLEWDKDGERLYETGVSKGVLYKKKNEGTALAPSYKWRGTVWNGLTAVNETTDGGEPNALYADDIKYLNLLSEEDFKPTVEAYTYPDEFAECDGSAEPVTGVYVAQQRRVPFGLSYVTKVGNDEEYQEYGYKLHLVYNCLASPSDKNYETINDTPDAITFSWEVSTTPERISDVTIDGTVHKFKPSAHLVIDTTKLGTTELGYLATLEQILYGTPEVTGTNAADAVLAELPTPDEVIKIMTTGSRT